MASSAMDLDRPVLAGTNGASSGAVGASATTELTQIIATFRPTKLFRRPDLKLDRPPPFVLSLDYNDPGELCMTSESDETIQLYNVKEGRPEKNLASKKYGVKLAKFTHSGSSIIYASTKQNDAIRYLETFDNNFICYFEGHTDAVTNLAMHPGTDNFISASRDNTVRLWNINSRNATGQLFLKSPYLLAWDPSGEVFAVASPRGGCILLYDLRHFNKAPFATFDVVDACKDIDPSHALKGWTKLEFSNDGKSVLLGTVGGGHFLLDAFDGHLKAYLRKPDGSTSRAAAGEAVGHHELEGSGDCCFTPDGRYVLSGTRSQNVLVWDTLGGVSQSRSMDPMHVLEDKREAAVLAFNPRFNFFATANNDVVFWLPDPYA